MTTAPIRSGLLVIFAAAAVALAGCGEFGEGQAVRPVPVPLSTPPPSQSWTHELIAEASADQSADVTAMSPQQYEALLADFRSWAVSFEYVAAQFRAIYPGWSITAADVEVFLRNWCGSDVISSTGFLLSKVPGAGLAALPAFNQVLGLAVQGCFGFDRRSLDWTSAVFANFTWTNQRAINAYVVPRISPPKARVDAMSVVYDAVCTGLQQGLSGWLARHIKSGRLNLWVTIMLEAGMVMCPATLQKVFV